MANFLTLEGTDSSLSIFLASMFQYKAAILFILHLALHRCNISSESERYTERLGLSIWYISSL
jgi:hypothetical protein